MPTVLDRRKMANDPRVHGDDGLGVEFESVVGLVASRGSGSLAGAAPRGEAVGVESGIPILPECIYVAAVSDSPDGPEGGVSRAELEPPPTDLLPTGRQTPLLIVSRNEVGVRMSRSVLTPNVIEQRGEKVE